MTVERLDFLNTEPPGYHVGAGGDFPSEGWGWMTEIGEPMTRAGRVAELATAARLVGQQAWYERRLALVVRLIGDRGPHRCPHACSCGWPVIAYGDRCAECRGAADDLGESLWPRALLFSNAECDASERWLIDSTAEMPEVLRG